MEFLGIGPLELLLVLLLALIIFGPKDLEKTGKAIGRGINKLVKSDTFKTVRQASEKIRSLPAELAREARLDEIQQSLDLPLQKPGPENPPGPLLAGPRPPSGSGAQPVSAGENRISPPSPDEKDS